MEMERRVEMNKQFLEEQQRKQESLGGHTVSYSRRRIMAKYETEEVLQLIKPTEPPNAVLIKTPETNKRRIVVSSIVPALHLKKPSPNRPSTSKESTSEVKVFSKAMADDLFCRFLAKNGIPFQNINDTLFEMFSKNVEDLEKYDFPSNDDLKQCLKKAVEKDKNIEYVCSNSKVHLTVDFIKEEETTYLAFSIHFYDEISSSRVDRIFLFKLDSFEHPTTSLFQFIRQISSSILPFRQINTSLLASKSVEQAIFKNSPSLCFFEILTKFANDVILLPPLKESANYLIDYVSRVKMNPAKYDKYRYLRKGLNNKLPNVDSSSWTSISIFIAKCLKIRSELSQIESMNTRHFRNIILLGKILGHCQKLAHRVASDNVISVIVPTVLDIIKFVDDEMADLSKSIKRLIDFHLFPLIIIEKNMMSCFFDPRFAYSPIYTEDTWMKIENNVSNLFYYKITTKDSSKWNDKIREQFHEYRCLVEKKRPGKYTNPFDWWKENNNSGLETFFEKAKSFLCEPAIAIDIHYYFGKYGKFRHICEFLEEEELNDMLKSASRDEQFRCRGIIAEKDVNLIMLIDQTRSEEQEDEEEGIEIVERNTHDIPEVAKQILVFNRDVVAPIPEDILMAEPRRKKKTMIEKAPEKPIKIEEDSEPGPSSIVKVEEEEARVIVKCEIIENEPEKDRLCQICMEKSMLITVCKKKVSIVDVMFVTVAQILNNQITKEEVKSRISGDLIDICRMHCVFYAQSITKYFGVNDWKQLEPKDMNNIFETCQIIINDLNFSRFAENFNEFFREYTI
ncbi:unnamed protein product [Caenorhabditis angaria]|uniref:Lin-15A/B-like domain-containing protein n=1 Tax=Caenorhabditis angaria TaxID=860376 RepID=A0A9P1IDA0_9PELO|nr:unnamed protein product [Caenorhabditis angaria]